MPRAYRVRASRPPLAEAARRHLLYGEEVERDAPGFEAYVDARWFRPRELWNEHRAELMRDFIAGRPGQRPEAWWWHDCPPRAERLKVGGSGRQSAAIDHERLYSCLECDPVDPPRVESVPAFLKRLGLLVPGEEKRIPKAAFKPLVLEVDDEGWARAGAAGYDPDEAA